MEMLDYEVKKPDQSEIEILRRKGEVIGKYLWDNKINRYNFLGNEPVTQNEMREILKGMDKLNKRSILPKWLRWGTE